MLKKEAEKISRELENYTGSAILIDTFRRELTEEFSDKFVGAYNGEVVVAEATIEDAVVVLKESGIPSEHTHLEFMTTDPRPLILSAA